MIWTAQASIYPTDNNRQAPSRTNKLQMKCWHEEDPPPVDDILGNPHAQVLRFKDSHYYAIIVDSVGASKLMAFCMLQPVTNRHNFEAQLRIWT